jgi:hypothetical protein
MDVRSSAGAEFLFTTNAFTGIRFDFKTVQHLHRCAGETSIAVAKRSCVHGDAQGTQRHFFG